jgi:hypothetical protein
MKDTSFTITRNLKRKRFLFAENVIHSVQNLCITLSVIYFFFFNRRYNPWWVLASYLSSIYYLKFRVMNAIWYGEYFMEFKRN